MNRIRRRVLLPVAGALLLLAPMARAACTRSVIPAGTKVIVRLEQPVDSQSAEAGATFPARIAEPIIIDGETLLAAGAAARVKLAEVELSPGAVEADQFALMLDEIVIRGKHVPVTTGFGQVAPGTRVAPSEMRIEGEAEPKDIVRDLTAGREGSIVIMGQGAGLIMHALKGPVVDVGTEIPLAFTLGELIALRQEEPLAGNQSEALVSRRQGGSGG